MATQGLVALLVSLLARPSAGAPGFALTSATLAAAGPRVAVLVVPMDLRSAQQQGAIEGAAEAALERAGRFTVVPVQDAFNPTNAKKRLELMAMAREKLASGKKAIDDLDNVKATADFRDALEFLQTADQSRGFAAMIDAWVMKAAGHATGGETAPAKKDIEAAVALYPRAEFSPTYFSPEFLKYADGQKKLAANAKGELLVKTEPAGARVWVDGQLRGVSPITVDGLSAGKHFVTAVAGGYALAQSQVSPGETELELTASELGEAWKKAMLDIKREPEGAGRDVAAQAVAQATGVDQVLLIIAKKSTVGDQLEFIAARLEAVDGHNAGYATGTLGTGDTEALSGFFAPVVGTDARRNGKRAVHHFAGGGAPDAQRLASYGLMGGGALVLITAVVLGTMALLAHNNYLTTPQTASLRSSGYRTEGRRLALVSDIFYAVGGAAVIGGGVLFALDFFGNKAPAKPLTASSSSGESQKAIAPANEEATPAPVEEAKPAASQEKAAVKQEKAAEPAPAAEASPAEPVKEEKPAEPPPKKLSKKEQAALAKKEREEAARQKKEEEKRRKEEEQEAARKKKEDEARAKEEEKEAARKKKEDEARAKEEEKEAARKKKEEEARAKEEEKEAARKKKADEKDAARRAKEDDKQAAEKKAQEEAAAKKQAEEDARAAEEAEKKKREEEKKRRDEKKKEEDHDDLRNY